MVRADPTREWIDVQRAIAALQYVGALSDDASVGTRESGEDVPADGCAAAFAAEDVEACGRLTFEQFAGAWTRITSAARELEELGLPGQARAAAAAWRPLRYSAGRACSVC